MLDTLSIKWGIMPSVEIKLDASREHAS